MKVYLDDERAAPADWVTARWPEDAIALLETGQVTAISLDHDLGDDLHGTGYSANPSARQKMQLAVERIDRFLRQQK